MPVLFLYTLYRRLIPRSRAVGERISVFVPIDGQGFKTEQDASAGALKLHFVLLLTAPMSKIAPATDDFAPSKKLVHHPGADPRGTSIGENETIPFFQAQPAIPCTAFHGGQLKLPIFRNPFFHSYDHSFRSPLLTGS